MANKIKAGIIGGAGYTGDDVRGFSKIFGNQVSIYHKVNAAGDDK